jgi:hypothetical protein
VTGHSLKPGAHLLIVAPSVSALVRALEKVDERLDQERIWRLKTLREARAIKDQWASEPSVEIHIISLKQFSL